MPAKPIDHAAPPARKGRRCEGGLLISHSAAGSHHTLHLRGELDLASAPDLLASASLLVYDASEIALDLSGVEFVDSTGLGVILRLRNLCRNHNCRLLLALPSPQVRRLLELTAMVRPLRADGLFAV